MSRGGRFKQVTFVSAELSEHEAMALAPLPPDPWYIRRPRGGIYLATGLRDRRFARGITEQSDSVVIDSSEGACYLRPGTQAHQVAQRALGLGGK